MMLHDVTSLGSHALRRVLACLCLASLVSSCAQPSGGIDWYDWTSFMESEGLMRTDRGVTEPLPQAEQLAQNFEKIGFSFEADPFESSNQVDQTSPRHIRRWVQPVVYQIYSLADGGADFEQRVNDFMDRLGRLTGIAIFPSRVSRSLSENPRGRFLIVHIPDSMLDAIGSAGTPVSESDGPRSGISDLLREKAEDWRYSTSPCAGSVWVDLDDAEDQPIGEPLFVIVVIRAEMPDRLLDACIEEELAQSMGLFADHEDLRPSIFNDDQEFALLIRQDELLLKILYDPRLSPGMPPETAMPIVRQIARELTSGL